MNTTISSNSLSALPQANTKPGNHAGHEAAAANGAGTSASVEDRVQLTDSARALQQASTGDSQSPVNSARVEQLRQAISNGSYQIDAGAIADRLTSLEGQIAGQ